MFKIVLSTIFFILALLFIAVGMDKINAWKKNKYHDPKAKMKLIQGVVMIGLAVAHVIIVIPVVFSVL